MLQGNYDFLCSNTFVSFRLLGHSRQSVQQVLERHGRLRGHVLWAGLRHHARQARHQVRVQVQVVLRCGVQRLRGHGGCPHLQAPQASRLVGHNLRRRIWPITVTTDSLTCALMTAFYYGIYYWDLLTVIPPAFDPMTLPEAETSQTLIVNWKLGPVSDRVLL